ncbi:MAG: MBL fold metallo-hydrolase [Phycisphaeraceae bacterium]
MLRHLALLLIVVFLPAPAAFAGKADGRLDIYWIDSEGGGSTLLVTPAGESILIDTGNPGGRDSGRIAKVAKEDAKLTQIDHVIITHYHRDHFGGAAELSKLIPIFNLYDNGHHDERKQEAGAGFDEYVKMEVKKRHVIQPGDQLSLLRTVTNAAPQPLPVTITCLGARQKFIEPTKDHKKNEHELAKNPVRRAEDKSDNANSVVLLIRFGDFDFLDCGDLTWNVEEKLVSPFNLVGEVDVYQVNHHGLDASNNPLLIQSVKPTVAVFNNGDTKGCQPLAFLAVKAAPSIQAIYQVHKNLRKDVQNNSTDEKIANHTKGNECEGHHVVLSVERDGKSYKVMVPARKHEAVYKSK